MKENILHYIWQFGHFNTSNLKTTDNLSIEIFKFGNKNSHQGPDFSEAKIKIEAIEWAGNVEIHVLSSDWLKHGHTDDYDNVILHVVYENDVQIFYKNGKIIPTLELKKYINSNVIEKCNQLLNTNEDILCASQWHEVSNISKVFMYDRVLTQRLERKAVGIKEIFEKSNFDWEQTTYHVLLQNFGFKTNAFAFGRLAELLPFKIIKKHTDNRILIEAMLYGVAGFLEEPPQDLYQQELTSQFAFLKSKYQLNTILSIHEWKYFRLRPPNFPTVKIAQIAGILQNMDSIHSVFLSCNSMAEIKKNFEIKPLPYWQNHYNFNKISKTKIANIGNSSIENVIINSVCQIKSAYGLWKDEREYITEAIQLLESLPAENNYINRKWQDLQYKAQNAYDSQSQIELYTNFCLQKKCLECGIGNEILGRR